MATAKIYCKVGTSKPKSVKSKIKDGTPVQVIQSVDGIRTVIAEGVVHIEGPPTPPVCQEHAHWDGIVCVCDTGYHDENGVCVPDETPPPPPTGFDKYGIRMLNPTVGRTWYNRWDNGIARSWGSKGTDVRNEDPEDPECDLHCKTGERGITTTAEVDGNGICTLTGTTPRLYINDREHAKRWLNVEMTVYFFIVKKLPEGGAYVACRLAGRSNHQNEYNCSASGTGYSSEVKNSNGTWQERRENGHPAYSVNNVSNIKGVEAGRWYGLKHIIQNIENDTAVHIKTLRDLTDGKDGGDWQPICEKIDRGDWPLEDKIEYNNINSCSEFKKVAWDKPLLDPTISCYLRCDNNQIRFKKFSVRSI